MMMHGLTDFKVKKMYSRIKV